LSHSTSGFAPPILQHGFIFESMPRELIAVLTAAYAFAGVVHNL
jgi:hypothetical protein